MHYYQFNIGDYASHTHHLSLFEDLAYRRLLDAYYLHEKPLNIDSSMVARQIGMREHADIVDLVLNEFFDLVEGEFVNPRADKEIQSYKGKLEQASRAGKASAERRFNTRSTGVQLNSKQETLNSKQEPKVKSATTVACPPDVSQEVWSDWLQLRKSKKASVTSTVIKGARSEADKLSWTLEQFLTEWCTRGSQGLKAEWIQEKQKPSYAQQSADVVRTTVPAHAGQSAALTQIIEDRKKSVPPPEHIRQMMRGILGTKNV
tara:strand:+ start:877 stop:1659 length:783 start_codon:yes stop_codon:yes gene_type:complete